MKFKDKKEYYSLRKFKGVGLASAVVGLAFLAPSVMAEETATTNASGSEVSLVNSVNESSDSNSLVSKPSVDKSTVTEDAPKILEPNVGPTTNNQQPTTNNQQPTTNNQQPTTNNQQLMRLM